MAVNMGVQNDVRDHGLWTQPVKTGVKKVTSVLTGRPTFTGRVGHCRDTLN